MSIILSLVICVIELKFACRVRLFSSTFWMVPEGCIKLMTFNMIKKYSQ